ncbi:MAG: DUF4158 domain-containing protein, partial [Chromatiaceae bacterium]|nr:DUF4158 domain-containing protein [Chromatiaceae bacterium]
MPHRTVLSASQRATFEALPTEHSELTKHYLLSDEDLRLIGSRRRAENRLGFAVQLCLVRYPGRVLRAGEQLPSVLVAFVADQIGAEAVAFRDYAHRDQTRREHVAFLVEHLGLSTFRSQHVRALVHWLVPIAADHPRGGLLVGSVLNECRQRRLLHPDLSVIERLVGAAMGRAQRRVLAEINGHLNAYQCRQLDAWLVPEADRHQSRFSWVRQPIGKPCPANMLAIIERLRGIRAFHLCPIILEQLSAQRRQDLSREGNRVAIHNLRMFSDARRYALMAVTLLELERALVDDALAMHDRIISRVLQQGKRRQAEALQAETKQIKQALALFASLGVAAREHNPSGSLTALSLGSRSLTMSRVSGSGFVTMGSSSLTGARQL